MSQQATPVPVQIVLGGKTFEMSPPTLRDLRQIMPAFNRVGSSLVTGGLTEEVLQDMIRALALGLKMPVEEIELVPCTVLELTGAFEGLLKVCGFEEMLRQQQQILKGMSPGLAGSVVDGAV